ncbi:MAG TPA: diguanylate cyclase, partial [Pyrinomonadaceae bacterium]
RTAVADFQALPSRAQVPLPFMYSLYDSLLAQHPRQLTSVKCAPSTIVQLHRYFEEVVLENSLNALVVESIPPAEEYAREATRIKQLVEVADRVFLFLGAGDALSEQLASKNALGCEASIIEQSTDAAKERFVVIADARFSALLASTSGQNDHSGGGDLVVWTFEPDVVYSALEYLMARVTAQHPLHSASFAKAVQLSMPKATSLQLTLGVTTKLARLLQEQAEREIAVNRIATAIRDSLELECLLMTAANELGRALNAKSCAVRVEGELVGATKTSHYFRAEPIVSNEEKAQLYANVEMVRAAVAKSRRSWITDGNETDDDKAAKAAVPLINEGRFVGLILIESDDASRVWGENELLLLHTVAEQLTVAVKQADMFAQMQLQALTDSLTGCYNRRSFEMQLEQNIQLATRMRQPMSLIMIDIDNFKHINDRAGHSTGDIALQIVADTLRGELRAVDTAARFGGDEFAIILPQANIRGALVVAERLQKRLINTQIPGYGLITASFGVASFPQHASSRDLLVLAADRALYESKHAGRNRISLAATDTPGLIPLETSQVEAVDIIQ